MGVMLGEACAFVDDMRLHGGHVVQRSKEEILIVCKDEDDIAFCSCIVNADEGKENKESDVKESHFGGMVS